jgi:hypothetical protein
MTYRFPEFSPLLQWKPKGKQRKVVGPLTALIPLFAPFPLQLHPPEVVRCLNVESTKAFWEIFPPNFHHECLKTQRSDAMCNVIPRLCCVDSTFNGGIAPCHTKLAGEIYRSSGIQNAAAIWVHFTLDEQNSPKSDRVEMLLQLDYFHMLPS